MIHLYCCYTEAHKVLFKDYFVPSLTNNVVVHAYRIDLAGPGDFLSVEFIECIRRKIDLIIASIDRHWGDIIVWSDVDILFYGDFEPDVRRPFADNADLDMVMQREGYHTTDINCGFFAARCNERTRGLFEAVKAAMLADPGKNEQPLINELLFEKKNAVPLNWEYLDGAYAARSHIWPPIDEIKLYHANCTAGADGIRQKHKQFADLQEYHPHNKVKVCLVTPELVGPRRNSGIGTHAFYFSRFLSNQEDTEVTLLLTSEVTEVPDGDYKSWAEYYKKEHGIQLELLEEQPPLYNEVGWFNQWFSLRTQAIYGWLRDKQFDICHFQDLNADGFMCLQARETGVAFQKTVMTVTVNGPNLWARQGMKQFADSPVDDALVNFCESYCLQKADRVLAPSKYALQWCRAAGWTLAEETCVCPYIIEPVVPANPEGYVFKEATEIVFFGRLETRKGMQIFLKTLKRLHRRGKLDKITRVYFVGSHAREQYFNSRIDIFKFFTNELPGLAFTIHEEFDHPHCLEFLRAHKDALVVAPSLTETLGYTILESLELNLNLVTTNAGAIPEIFENSDRLCEPTADGLAGLMELGLQGQLPPVKMRYDRDRAVSAWADAQAGCVELLGAKMEAMETIPGDPEISVLIPHHNYGAYLKEQLASLAKQSYKNFEVIVLDDGSSDEESLHALTQLEKDYADDTRFHFIRQENAGLCEARNRLAREARHDLLIFCDADNISDPNMLSTYARAIQISQADCVTCHMAKFRNFDGERKMLDTYTPLGACIEAGPFVDPYGDANFIIRKEVFEKLGGFRKVPHTASEDWEFLAKLILDGYKLEVAPIPLFNYREHGESNMRQTPFFDTRMRVLQPYMDSLKEPWQKRLLYNCVGSYEREMVLRKLHIPDEPTRELLKDHRDYIDELEAAVQSVEHRAQEANLRAQEANLRAQASEMQIVERDKRYRELRKRYARYKWIDKLIHPFLSSRGRTSD